MNSKRKRKGIIPFLGGGLLIAAALSLVGYNMWDSRRAEAYTAQVAAQLLEVVPETPEWAPDWNSQGNSQAPPEEASSNAGDGAIMEEERVMSVTLPVGEGRYQEYVEMDLPVQPGGGGRRSDAGNEREYYINGDKVTLGASNVQYPDYVLNPDRDMPTKEINRLKFGSVLDIPALGLTLPILADYNYDQLVYCPARYTGTAYRNNMVICAHNYDGHFGRLHSLGIGAQVKLTDMDGNAFHYQVTEVETLAGNAVREMTAKDGWDLTLFTCTLGGRTRVTVRCSRVY